MNARDVVITGIGLVSSLGEGSDMHWDRLTADRPQPVYDSERFAPYTVHPLPQIDWGLQIPKRGDQRQMETWQRLGTYTAGLALDDAGIKGDAALCASMDMVIAAGGGERDEAVDSAILHAAATRNDPGVLLNEKLTTELRPTLFLAQLSNLAAGNISIVHQVTGSSRTFMGEEGAGIAAVETAAARIRAGQSTHVLVGAAFQTEHPDMLLAHELGGTIHRGEWKPVWQRRESDGGGLVTGSGAAFLVLESREHAQARGRRPYAQIAAIASDQMRRRKGDLAAGIARIVGLLGADRPMLAISGASGARAATQAETAFFGAHPELAARGFATLVGHFKEAQFPFAVALAALAVAKGRAYPAFDTDGEKPFSGDMDAVLAMTIGYHLAEGAALVTKP